MSDAALRPLMRKITVAGNPAYTKLRHQRITVGTTVTPASIRICDRSGREFFQEVMVHKGHMDDPMTREDLYAKFDVICKGGLRPQQIENIRTAWWNVAQAADIREPIHTLTGLREL
jgi:2-methylcitrate dehydratase PrpD